MLGSAPSSHFEAIQARLLWSKRHHFAPGETFFSERVVAHALWLMLEGSIEVRIADGGPDQRWRVEMGQVFLGAPCRMRHLCAPHGARWLTAGLRLTTAHGFDLLESEGTRLLRPTDAQSAHLEMLLSLLADSTATPGQGGALMREGLSLALGGWCFSVLGQREPGWFTRHQELPLWLHKALSYIETHPGVSVEELASQAHFSVAQFRRLFARHLGVTPQAYLRQRRLELGRLWLESGNLSLSVIAAQAGWGSLAHFSREFKRNFGMTPLEWRRVSRTLI